MPRRLCAFRIPRSRSACCRRGREEESAEEEVDVDLVGLLVGEGSEGDDRLLLKRWHIRDKEGSGR